jgi:hypothetical protein
MYNYGVNITIIVDIKNYFEYFLNYFKILIASTNPKFTTHS